MKCVKKIQFLCYFLILYAVSSKAQLTIKLGSIPSSTPETESIFVAGNFNNWNPISSNHKFFKNQDSTWSVTFNPTINDLEFKFTRGSWAKVEGSSTGTYIPNRFFKYDGKPTTIVLHIAGWEDIKEQVSTASKNVSVLSDSFYMNSLNRYRRIWIYLPPDYDSSAKEYSVVYMHDGQNLFDKKTSFAGEWSIDETMDKRFKNNKSVSIVVGIDNGGSKRLDELSPWKNINYGGGEGDKYLDFIKYDLLPYINSKYRTKKEAKYTALIGSSMGGLISLYGGVKHNDTFGKIGALSSAFWFAREVYSYVNSFSDFNNLKIYMIAGGKEGGNQIGDMIEMKNLLISKGFIEGVTLKAVDHPEEKHNEAYWEKEFDNVYSWLFDETSSTEEDTLLKSNYFYIDSQSIIYGGEKCTNCSVMITDLSGKIIVNESLLQSRWHVGNGTFFIILKDADGKEIAKQKLISIK
ncbi:MAG: hypothetical protein RLZZ546_1666 [Bacteroidota bacterium]|jgi:predicted alpha/beta superfamily hydrolase